MQAIVVKYLSPTNTRGSRLKVSAAAGSVTISYPYGVNQSDTARVAAEALCEKLGGPRAGWDSSRLIEGTLPNGDAVLVFAPRA